MDHITSSYHIMDYITSPFLLLLFFIGKWITIWWIFQRKHLVRGSTFGCIHSVYGSEHVHNLWVLLELFGDGRDVQKAHLRGQEDEVVDHVWRARQLDGGLVDNIPAIEHLEIGNKKEIKTNKNFNTKCSNTMREKQEEEYWELYTYIRIYV